MASALRFGLLSAGTVHLCIDMQTLFAERTDWHVPWFERVLPAVARPAEARRGGTVFTRFVPPECPEEAIGAWRRYYRHWREMTGERLDPRLIELVPPLAALAPPAYRHRQEPLFPLYRTGLSQDTHRLRGRYAGHDRRGNRCLRPRRRHGCGSMRDYRRHPRRGCALQRLGRTTCAMLRHSASRFSQQIELAPRMKSRQVGPCSLHSGPIKIVCTRTRGV